MISNINNANKPVTPIQATPVLKTVANPSENQKTEHKNILSIDVAKAEKEKATEENKKTEQTLDDAVKQLNSYAQAINRSLEFNIDTDNGQTVVKVIDSDTDEIIRQIPNEEALQITKRLDNKLINESSEPGLLLTKLQA